MNSLVSLLILCLVLAMSNGQKANPAERASVVAAADIVECKNKYIF